MSVSVGVTGTGSLPVQTTRTETLQQQENQAGTGYTANRYTADQQRAQGQVLGGLGAIMNGQSVPSNFGLPQSVYDAHMLNINKYVVPQLAAQHGAGSPAIPSQIAQEILQLSALSGQQAMQNYNAYAGNLGQLAFTPTGADKGDQTAANLNRTINETSTGVDYGGVLSAILGGLNAFGLSPAPTFR